MDVEKINCKNVRKNNIKVYFQVVLSMKTLYEFKIDSISITSCAPCRTNALDTSYSNIDFTQIIVLFRELTVHKYLKQIIIAIQQS